MTTLEALAEFVQDSGLAEPPSPLLDQLKLHLLDTLGALLAGGRTPEGEAMGAFVARRALPRGVKVPGFPATADLATSVLAGCATTRLTEADDIHLASCTTPGSVIVPTALALASAGEVPSFGEFAAAVITGYEMLIRLGLAAGGPSLLENKLWPTYFAAAFGSAATAARCYRLSVPETAGALGTALTFCTGTAISPRSPATSRWLALGAAAANGVLAATGARDGLLGDSDLIERTSGRISGVECSTERLLDGLGRDFQFSATGLKPFPVARQALAAIEAVRELAATERLSPAMIPTIIDEIVVQVPGPQRPVINHPEIPRTRIASIISVQYQASLALLAPERLPDVVRTPPFMDDPLRQLMMKVRVERAEDLEKYYPAAWPARVEVVAGGRRWSRQVLHPRGDAERPLAWDEVIGKFRAMAGPFLDAASAERVASQVRDLDVSSPTPALWDLRPA